MYPTANSTDLGDFKSLVLQEVVARYKPTLFTSDIRPKQFSSTAESTLPMTHRLTYDEISSQSRMTDSSTFKLNNKTKARESTMKLAGN